MTASATPPRRNPINRALGGWQPARVLMVANRLEVFTHIGEGFLSAAEITARCGSHPRSTTLLLNACVALGLLEKRGERYINSAEALASLVKGKPGYMGDAINHSDRLWTTWGELEQSVRTNRPATVSASISADPGVHYDFIMAMHNNAMSIGHLLAENLDLSGRRQLFDVGGGPGTYSIFLVQRYPDLKAIVFDLPATILIAQKMIASFGVGDRVTTRAGDYFRDDFGEGNDVVLLSAILHSMDPTRCQLLLRKAWDSLVSGGLVAVHEGIIDPDGTSPLFAALFSLNMLVNTRGGQSYSGEEVISWMREIGFVNHEVRKLAAPAFTSLVMSTKP